MRGRGDGVSIIIAGLRVVGESRGEDGSAGEEEKSTHSGAEEAVDMEAEREILK